MSLFSKIDLSEYTEGSKKLETFTPQKYIFSRPGHLIAGGGKQLHHLPDTQDIIDALCSPYGRPMALPSIPPIER